jgi:hypothetical protein
LFEQAIEVARERRIKLRMWILLVDAERRVRPVLRESVRGL